MIEVMNTIPHIECDRTCHVCGHIRRAAVKAVVHQFFRGFRMERIFSSGKLSVSIGRAVMLIRLMKTEDYNRVHALWMSCVGMGLNNLDDSKEGIERFLNRNQIPVL